MSERNNLTILAHTDYLIDVAERRSRGEVRVMEHRHVPTLKSGGVDIICDHVGGDTNMFSTFPLDKILTSSDLLERALNGVDCMCSEAEESSELIVVRDMADIEKVRKSEQVGIILCLQGGSPIRMDLSLLRIFYRLGVRCLHLTANRRNQISDSCVGRTQGGLTDFGMNVVDEMNGLGMVIDISQLSPAGCVDVLNESSDPVIASNSNVRSLCNHPRNLEDNVIELVGANDGVICIHCLPSFLVSGERATVADMVRHIDYLVDMIGIDHVGIGPDLLENWPEEKHSAMWTEGQKLGKKTIEFNYPEGFSSISDIPNLSTHLAEAGYSDVDCQKILGENLVRVFRRVWK